MIIPFTYNLLKKHPALMVMIHRKDETYEATNGQPHIGFVKITRRSFHLPIDPFNPAERNPTLTNALESSLWELYTQKSHYHSAVSTLARIFEEAFTKPNYALEDFLDHTYSTVRVLNHHLCTRSDIVHLDVRNGGSQKDQEGTCVCLRSASTNVVSGFQRDRARGGRSCC